MVALWTILKCMFGFHEYTPLEPTLPRSHCKFCGKINPDDWW